MNMMNLIFTVVLLLVCLLGGKGFSFSSARIAKRALSMSFDLDRAIDTLSSNKILTKTSQLGLLTRLEKAGFTLSTAVPLLKLAEEKDLLGYLEASSDKVLPLIAKAIELSPSLLPLAAPALNAPPAVFFAGAAGSLGAAGLLIATVPDDSVTNVALQVAAGVPLGVLLPGALAVGGTLLGKLPK